MRYFYDGVNEIVEYDGSGNRSRFYIHGISYVDERLMTCPLCREAVSRVHDETNDRPYYYTIDRMYNPLHVCQGYNVRSVVDRAGAIVERYAYDPYGRPLIRESAGRGDMDDDTDMGSADQTRLNAAYAGTIWDARADLDDDGDVDNADRTQYTTKKANWPPQSNPTVAQAFSDVSNPFMFQGRPHFAFDTEADATEGELMVNDHRARMNDPVTGRWVTKDPQWYNEKELHPRHPKAELVRRPRNPLQRKMSAALFLVLMSNPTAHLDASGLDTIAPDSANRAILIGCGLEAVADNRPAVFRWSMCCGCLNAINALQGPYDVN